MTPTVDRVFSEALSLPPVSRAALADLLRLSLLDTAGAVGSCNDEMDVDQRAKLLTEHFHEAKRTALSRVKENLVPAAAELPGNDL